MKFYQITELEEERLLLIVSGHEKPQTEEEKVFMEGYECALVEMDGVEALASTGTRYQTFTKNELYRFMVGFGVGQKFLKELTGSITQ